MTQRKPTGPATAALALAAALVAAPGCDPSGPNVRMRPFPPPAEPLAQPELAEQWYYGWVTDRDVLDPAGVRDMIVIGTTAGRDWRPPDGPDGYALRAVLLDAAGEATRAPGSFKAFLVQEPARSTSRAIRAWWIRPDEAAERYAPGIMPGYVLQLDWGPEPPPPHGTYMLVVRWEARDANYRFTRNMVFAERMLAPLHTERIRWPIRPQPGQDAAGSGGDEAGPPSGDGDTDAGGAAADGGTADGGDAGAGAGDGGG